jgi:hypothetical protein
MRNFYQISYGCNVVWQMWIMWDIFVGDLPYIPAKFGFTWPSSVTEDDFKWVNQKQEMPMAAMIFIQSEHNDVLLHNISYNIPPKIGYHY